MPGVFISYRRQDSAGHAGRLFDRLQTRIGPDHVFMDVAGIDAGADFVQRIDQALESSTVLLAVIGPEWLACRNSQGQRRLDDPSDFVRLEIAKAFERGRPVIPVLIAGASIPPPDALPDLLKPLARRQTVELRDTRWDADTNDLIVSLERLVPAAPAGRVPRRRQLALAIVAVLAVGIIASLGLRYADGVGETPAPASNAAATPVTSIASPPRVLNYTVTARRNPQRDPASVPVAIATDTVLSAGDLVRLSFSSPQPGFLYVINEGPPGSDGIASFNILFPSFSARNGSARLDVGEEVRIPARGDGFVLDAEAGTEKLWLVWSAHVIDDLNALLRWANERDGGEIKDARDVSALRAFLATHASPAPAARAASGAAGITLQASGDTLVKLVTLEHRQ
jgi:hypothetical protein